MRNLTFLLLLLTSLVIGDGSLNAFSSGANRSPAGDRQFPGVTEYHPGRARGLLVADARGFYVPTICVPRIRYAAAVDDFDCAPACVEGVAFSSDELDAAKRRLRASLSRLEETSLGVTVGSGLLTAIAGAAVGTRVTPGPGTRALLGASSRLKRALGLATSPVAPASALGYGLGSSIFGNMFSTAVTEPENQLTEKDLRISSLESVYEFPGALAATMNRYCAGLLAARHGLVPAQEPEAVSTVASGTGKGLKEAIEAAQSRAGGGVAGAIAAPAF